MSIRAETVSRGSVTFPRQRRLSDETIGHPFTYQTTDFHQEGE